ncbi:GCN5-related N-acetyltransferase [Nostoc sp. NIES-3756]|uniref:GNAT family N-acetyltransferase n=1 Tax=Nostoc sp. NIES-3756 TaxID=1751286 RepID=UPI00071F2216|nr:GNAT family N-acetyltransferase [Nostoc sp. NIES-3756]BAT55930.1 GCN5-related N-acetyltransferase [Nostoc sp. NIES-3756]
MENENFSLPSGCKLRRATSDDIWSIRWLVFSSILDPTQLLWQQFWVIQCQEKIVACAQLRNFSQAQELGSLVVTPAWRGRGLASFLTHHLIITATQPLYLECIGERLAQFYQGFSFVPIAFEELPKSLQPKFRISQLAKKLLRVPVIFMQYRGGASHSPLSTPHYPL